MNWETIGKQLLAIGAPLLGTAIVGPAGGVVAKMLVDKFGGGDSSPENVAEVIKKISPDKLKDFESEHRIKLIELANADRADARSREVELAKVTGEADWVPKFLAVALTAGFWSLVAALVFVSIPDANRNIINIIIGTMSSGYVGIMGYYFGSSASSAKKTQIMGVR